MDVSYCREEGRRLEQSGGDGWTKLGADPGDPRVIVRVATYLATPEMYTQYRGTADPNVESSMGV